MLHNTAISHKLDIWQVRGSRLQKILGNCGKEERDVYIVGIDKWEASFSFSWNLNDQQKIPGSGYTQRLLTFDCS